MNAKPFIFVSIVSILMLIYLINDTGNYGMNVKPADAAPISQFRVVDTYKGCDVVEWHYGMLAEYRYFLDCTDEMMQGMPYGGTSIKARKEKYD
jgi:hypothetical protein